MSAGKTLESVAPEYRRLYSSCKKYVAVSLKMAASSHGKQATGDVEVPKHDRVGRRLSQVKKDK